VPQAVGQRLWFQHDGTPAHYGEDACQWLNIMYPGRWIGWEGLIVWPPRSPDQTPMDFFLWGHLKEHVYTVPSRTVEYLVARLQAVMTVVDANMVACVRESAVHVMHCCLPGNGQRLLQTPIVAARSPWFDHLIACAI
jgi:hypothetical protein